MKVFKEEQKFTQTWLHIIMFFTSITPTAIIVKQWVNNADKSLISNKSSLFTIIIIILVHILIYIANLKTKIDERGIHYQFFPFHFSVKLIPWNEISKAGIRTYFPISEFGGWGLRGGFFFNKGKGKAINVSGDVGIQLILKNGDKLLIGTQKKEEVIRVLETYKNKIQ